ncbi:MAG: Ig-like domain-containing protein, partial [Thermoflexales bacterium]|nr:Ig-like domain-containing protein [Thermoflexales bacterium]
PVAVLSLTATPSVIFANGISQSVVVATATDAFGNLVSGATVQFLAGLSTFSPASGTTGANGKITVTLTSLTPGTELVSAVSGSVVAQTSVTYQTPPAPLTGLSGSLQTITQALGAVRKGSLITYNVVISNPTAATVSGILLVAPIPSGTTFVPGSASGGNYVGSLSLASFGIEDTLEPQAMLNAVVWAGNLAAGGVHTVTYAVQVQILEGVVVNQPTLYVNNQNTGINLSSSVLVEAFKRYLPIMRRQ